MKLSTNTNLKNSNSFKLSCISKKSCIINSREELRELNHEIDKSKSKFFILGGGSNILLPEFYNGISVLNKLKGIKIVTESEKNILIECNGGESWDEFVEYCTNNGYFGLENLSYIPGTVGAAPVQNISAYGIEVKSFIDSVNLYDFDSNSFQTLKNHECKFEYRNSIFKTQTKLLVTSVIFKLSKIATLSLDYKDLQEEIKNGIAISTPLELRNTVIKIRKKKLPDPETTPNVGSFFHNPIIDKELVESLQRQYEKIPNYPYNSYKLKLSAGWLIEQSGLKGHACGNIKISEKHALILTNPDSKASQKEVLEFADYIIKTVNKKFDITLHIEPIIIR